MTPKPKPVAPPDDPVPDVGAADDEHVPHCPVCELTFCYHGLPFVG